MSDPVVVYVLIIFSHVMNKLLKIDVAIGFGTGYDDVQTSGLHIGLGMRYLPYLTFKVRYSKNLMLSWQLHGTTRENPHTNIFNMAATVIDNISSDSGIFLRF